MTVFEAFMLLFTFGALLVSVLSFHHKK
ncbi:putative holin-like toxin [Sporosarcina sp. 179-K 3D1 HS]